MKRKSKKGAWFYKIRGSYLPCSWQGLTIYFIYLVYVVALPIAWLWKGHDFWNLLVAVVPLWIGAALIAQYVASKHA